MKYQILCMDPFTTSSNGCCFRTLCLRSNAILIKLIRKCDFHVLFEHQKTPLSIKQKIMKITIWKYVCVISFKMEQKSLTWKWIICPDAEKGRWLSFRLCNVKQKHSETECKNTVWTFFFYFYFIKLGINNTMQWFINNTCSQDNSFS